MILFRIVLLQNIATVAKINNSQIRISDYVFTEYLWFYSNIESVIPSFKRSFWTNEDFEVKLVLYYILC